MSSAVKWLLALGGVGVAGVVVYALSRPKPTQGVAAATALPASSEQAGLISSIRELFPISEATKWDDFVETQAMKDGRSRGEADKKAGQPGAIPNNWVGNSDFQLGYVSGYEGVSYAAANEMQPEYVA